MVFLDTNDVPITRVLEKRWELIRDEDLAVPPDAFDPWIQRNMRGQGWSVYGLFADGHAIPGGCAHCPQTAEVIAQLDGVGLAGFSRMVSETHITPHSGCADNEFRLHPGRLYRLAAAFVWPTRRVSDGNANA